MQQQFAPILTSTRDKGPVREQLRATESLFRVHTAVVRCAYFGESPVSHRREEPTPCMGGPSRLVFGSNAGVGRHWKVAIKARHAVLKPQ